MKTNEGTVLSEKKMADGRTLRILRFVSPGDEVPERVVRYVIGSLGFDSYNEYIQTQAYWRSWYRESFEGKLDGVESHLYLAEVDGVLAARVWFAYAREGGFGNFGNVYTETAYRRLGLLGELMAPCMADFDAAGDARILCCGSGNRFAVRTYLKRGFRLTYGGEIGFLERTRRPGEDFFSIEREVFADARLASSARSSPTRASPRSAPARPPTSSSRTSSSHTRSRSSAASGRGAAPPPPCRSFASRASRRRSGAAS